MAERLNSDPAAIFKVVLTWVPMRGRLPSLSQKEQFDNWQPWRRRDGHLPLKAAGNDRPGECCRLMFEQLPEVNHQGCLRRRCRKSILITGSTLLPIAPPSLSPPTSDLPPRPCGYGSLEKKHGDVNMWHKFAEVLCHRDRCLAIPCHMLISWFSTLRSQQ